MEITRENINNIVVIHLEGNVMGGPEAVKVNEEINQLLDNKKEKLIIDLSKVNRMNSSGLGILINALTTFKQNGGELKLANLTDRVKGLLAITKLNTIFETYDNVDSAINSF
jgi:anti-sigma B factor antagonist